MYVISFLEDFTCVGVGGWGQEEIISLKTEVATHHLETYRISLCPDLLYN